MNPTGQSVQAHVEQPTHAVPRKAVMPILFLADQMSHQDRIQPPPARWMVDELAEALGFHEIRRQMWYRQLDEKKACEQLDLLTLKKAALVALTLVMKADTTRGEKAKAYFSKIRGMLGAEPIVVPGDQEEHRKLALKYLGG